MVPHLLTPDADEQVRQIQSLLVRGMGEGFDSRTILVGPGGDCRGVPGAVAMLRRERPEVVVAWGLKPLVAAVLARCPRILFSPERFAGPRALGWIKLLMQRGDVTMVCPSNTQRRLAVARGIDPRRCVVVRPGVDLSALPAHRDEVLRRELGFGERDFVVIAPGESTLISGHEHAVWAAVIMSVLDANCKLLVWGRGPRAGGLPRLPGRLNLDLVTLAEQKLGRAIAFEQLLGAADVCLATPTGIAPILPVALAMGAGVPVVAVVNSALAELVEDEQTALTVPGASPRALVQRVLDLRADAGLRERMVSRAREAVAERWSMQGMIEAWRGLMELDAKIAGPI